MKRKRYDRRDWARVQSGTQTLTSLPGGVMVDYRAGEVVRPLDVPFQDRTLRILDTGYRWLHYVEPGQHHALMVQLSDRDQPLQLYVDICDSQGLDPDGIPFIHDLYLDVIALCEVLPDGCWHVTATEIIDMDELDEALAVGKITQAQHDLAWAEARAVQQALETNTFPATQMVQEYLRAMA